MVRLRSNSCHCCVNPVASIGLNHSRDIFREPKSRTGTRSASHVCCSITFLLPEFRNHAAPLLWVRRHFISEHAELTKAHAGRQTRHAKPDRDTLDQFLGVGRAG